MLIKNESLKYLRYNAVGHSPAVLVPARSVLATVVGFVSQFTVNKQNYQVHRIEEWDQVSETCSKNNNKMLQVACRRVLKSLHVVLSDENTTALSNCNVY